jgi:protein-disulfide isomerase
MENNNTKQQISTPVAIIVAGVLIMIGILATKGVSNTDPKSKTLSEQVGVSKEKLLACVKETDLESLNTNINDGVEKAMGHMPREERGTPYSIIIGKDGVKTEIRGADSYANVKTIVDEALLGKVTAPYLGNVTPPVNDEHILGNPDAAVTIIEYSDYECPYCKQFDATLKQIVKESDGNVRWIYRHYPLHQHSFEKLVAAECITKLKGNDAFWKYSDLLFGLLKTGNESVSEQL